MKNMIKLAGVAAVALAMTQTIQATPITGSIGFGGDATFNTSSAGTATEVTGWANTVVLSDAGTFASYITPIASASFTSATWTFADPYNNPLSFINNFWQAGGFSFQLQSSAVVTQLLSGYLNVTGSGVVSGNGFTPTLLSWSFTAQDPSSGVVNGNTVWTFSASSNSVPDGGATVMLLGLALSGAALLKKRLMA